MFFNLSLTFSLRQWRFLSRISDIQCFMVKPVLNMPQQFKDKGVPEQILKCVKRLGLFAFLRSDGG